VLGVLEGPLVAQTIGDARSANMIRITGADGLAGAKGPMGGGGIKKYVQLKRPNDIGAS
jgi:hypothetical protein